MGKSTARRRGREKAAAILREIHGVSSQLPEQERKGFLQKIHRSVYEQRKRLYPHGLHPNQKR